MQAELLTCDHLARNLTEPSAAQVVEAPRQRARWVLAIWRGPDEPRPPGVPATLRPVVTP